MSFSKYYFDDLNYPIKCPSCFKEFLPINSIKYNSLNSDFILSYNCSNSTNKNLKHISLKKLLLSLNKESPNYPQYCPYHIYENAPFICPECDNFLCKECYFEHILFYKEREINEKYKNIDNRKCLVHNLNYINYCNKCRNFVCKNCIENTHFYHEKNWVFLNKSYNDLNKEINLKVKLIKKNIDENIKKIDNIIFCAEKLKEEIINSFNNYLNIYLPLINIYKILSYNTKESPNNLLNSLINSFNFNYFIETKNSKNIEETINNSNNKIKKEISLIQSSLTNISKSINIIFSKINFKYENQLNENNKIMTTDDPFKINKNTKTRFTRHIKTLKSHYGAIYKLIKLSNGKFASCSADGTIIIWDDYLMEMSVKIQAHNSSVNSICEIDNNILISCSNDNTIKLWNINNDYSLIQKIHIKQPILIFKLKNGFFLSFSGKQINIFSSKNYNCILTKEITEITNLCNINDNLFAASKEDSSIEIFNIFNIFNKNKIDSIILNGIDDLVSSMLAINNKKLICGYYEGDIIVWNIEEKKIDIEIRKAHEYNVNVIIQLKNNSIASASNDKKIKIWDLFNKQLLTCFVNAHDMSIRAMIQINNGNIITGGSDEVIKIWG